MTTNLDAKYKQDLAGAAKLFERAVIAVKPEWVLEARLILHFRQQDYSFGRIAAQMAIATEEYYTPQTAKNRLDWALAVYRNQKHKP